jgi:hypothetical protein
MNSLFDLPGKKEKLLTDDQLDRLRYAYGQMKRIKSDHNGSAYGEHHKLIALLRELGVKAKFEASAQVENFVEHVITYNETPKVY